MKVENDMDYKIIADSCCDLTDEMKDWGNLALVPLTLELGDYRIMDDENFDQDDFIARMQALGDVPRSACPSPDAFCAAIAADDAKEVYVLTITDKLSGCYNSALQGVMLYEDDHPGEKKIHVFNSLATSGLETLIAYEIRRLKDSGLPFEQVVEQVEDYIHNHTALYFCLESLDALKNNGRLFSLAATVIKKLKMKLICQRSSEGTISLAGQDFADCQGCGGQGSKPPHPDHQPCVLPRESKYNCRQSTREMQLRQHYYFESQRAQLPVRLRRWGDRVL